MRVIGKILKFIPVGLVLFLSLFCIASASFEITEVMYDLDGTDTGREWVEVYNNGSENSDFSHWYFFSDNTKHSLVPDSQSNIPAGGYAVITQDISKFKADWPNYSGLIFDSSWTGLNNDGETIALKDPDLNIVSQISFTSGQGGGGDGNSLQKVNGSWVGAIPTPGLQNQSSGGGGVGNSGSGSGSGGGSTSPSIEQKPIAKKEVEVSQITTNILAKNTAFAGLPLKISFRTTGLKKEPIVFGRFAWNFGDGTSFSLSEQKDFEHIYSYSGDYVLALSYYSNPYAELPEATDRIIVKILQPEIFISSVGSGVDTYVELTNNSSYELDLSHWTIKSYLHSFVIPKGTTILQNSKIKISPKLTDFKEEDLKYLMLENKSGELIATYPKITKSNYPKNNINSAYSNSEKSKEVIDLNNLGASAANSNSSISSSGISIVGLALIIIAGIMTVVLIRKNDSRKDELEGSLKASDIDILE